MVTQPTVWFHVPTHEVTADSFPPNADTYWEWIRAQKDIDAWGPYDWTLRTYLELKRAGVPCEMSHVMPSEGIVVAHRDFFPDDLCPSPNLLFVCIVADRQQPGFTGLHPFSQLFLVQNPRDRMLEQADPLWHTTYITSWQQPSLLPRDIQRGDAFENVAYFGWPQNLVDPLTESGWRKRLEAMDLTWRIVDRSQWHDYHDVDAVVAIRSFANCDFGYKPAAKLFNSWHAGVPCIVGRESSFLAERRSDLDFLEARSFEEAVAAVRRLREDVALRRAMVANGNERARETSTAALVQRWTMYLADVATPAWSRWCAMPATDQDRFLDQRSAAVHTMVAAEGQV